MSSEEKVRKKWSPNQCRIPAGQSKEVEPFVMSTVGTTQASGGIGHAVSDASVRETAALQASYQEGYNAGTEAGMARVRKELEEECRAISAIIQGVEQLRTQVYEQMNDEIINLVLHIVRKIIRVELQHNPEATMEMIKEAIRIAVDREVLKVSVNARDFETLNGRRPELLHSQDGIKKLVFDVDETIQPGGCLIETRYGDVDARVNHQIEVIGNELRKTSQDG